MQDRVHRPARRGDGPVGNKDKAKQSRGRPRCRPCPGSEGLITIDEEALKFAHQVGYPVLIKAAAGGGGRGMRVARNDTACTPARQQAAAEAEAAFKDGSVFLEKYLDRPRHIEVQMLGDQQGNVVHLYERDCSLQRRHQKLVEESPAPNLPDEGPRAPSATRPCGSARRPDTTVPAPCEFLVDKDNNFYFIEVNARIQVEHPVTELVTGVDLIREQIRIAAGEKLRFRQKDIMQRGAAIECPDQRGGPGEGLPAERRHDHEVGAARRPGRAARFARRHGLQRAAELRLDGRETPRPPADSGRGARGHAAGATGVQGRRHPHHDPDPRQIIRNPGVHQREGGHGFIERSLMPPKQAQLPSPNSPRGPARAAYNLPIAREVCHALQARRLGL